MLQRAVVMVLEAVYKEDFLDCSYGFRPGRSAHQALDVLWHELMAVSGGCTFDLPGFTHYWGRTRRGGWAVKRKTAADRFSRALSRIDLWCRKHWHLKVREQWRALSRKLTGHFGYYGIPGNWKALSTFRDRVRSVWRKWLSRRSQKALVAWDRFVLLERRYPLPPARLVRPLRVT